MAKMCGCGCLLREQAKGEESVERERRCVCVWESEVKEVGSWGDEG